jgi:hypothetical protein
MQTDKSTRSQENSQSTPSRRSLHPYIQEKQGMQLLLDLYVSPYFPLHALISMAENELTPDT